MSESSSSGYSGNVAAGVVAGIIITVLLVGVNILAIVLAGFVAGLIARGASRGAIAGAASGIILTIVVIIFSVLGSTAFNFFNHYSSYSVIISTNLSLVSYITGLGSAAMYTRLVVFGIVFSALGGLVAGFLVPHSLSVDDTENTA